MLQNDYAKLKDMVKGPHSHPQNDLRAAFRLNVGVPNGTPNDD